MKDIILCIVILRCNLIADSNKQIDLQSTKFDVYSIPVSPLLFDYGSDYHYHSNENERLMEHKKYLNFYLDFPRQGLYTGWQKGFTTPFMNTPKRIPNNTAEWKPTEYYDFGNYAPSGISLDHNTFDFAGSTSSINLTLTTDTTLDTLPSYMYNESDITSANPQSNDLYTNPAIIPSDDSYTTPDKPQSYVPSDTSYTTTVTYPLYMSDDGDTTPVVIPSYLTSDEPYTRPSYASSDYSYTTLVTIPSDNRDTTADKLSDENDIRPVTPPFVTDKEFNTTLDKISFIPLDDNTTTVTPVVSEEFDSLFTEGIPLEDILSGKFKRPDYAPPGQSPEQNAPREETLDMLSAYDKYFRSLSSNQAQKFNNNGRRLYKNKDNLITKQNDRQRRLMNSNINPNKMRTRKLLPIRDNNKTYEEDWRKKLTNKIKRIDNTISVNKQFDVNTNTYTNKTRFITAYDKTLININKNKETKKNNNIKTQKRFNIISQLTKKITESFKIRRTLRYKQFTTKYQRYLDRKTTRFKNFRRRFPFREYRYNNLYYKKGIRNENLRRLLYSSSYSDEESLLKMNLIDHLMHYNHSKREYYKSTRL